MSQVRCDIISKCYDNVNSCFWTDERELTWQEADAVCRQSYDSFLPRLSSPNVYSTLKSFRLHAASNNYRWERLSQVWIDARAVPADNWHWRDGTSFTGSCCSIMLLICRANFPSRIGLGGCRMEFLTLLDGNSEKITFEIAWPCM